MSIKVNSIEAFLLAFRLKTLGAISAPILIGHALAFRDHHFNVIVFMNILICGLLLQILANIINDYGDHKRGKDTKERLGPKRAMQMGIVTSVAMKKSIILLLAIILLLGVFLFLIGGYWVLVVGISSIALCFWYTMGPWPLSFLGFSEIFILIFFGPLPVLGSYYLQTGKFSFEALTLSLAPALLSTSLMMCNNLRDIKEDAKFNKKTIAVRFGEMFCRISIVSMILIVFFFPLLLINFFDWPVLSSISSLAIIGPILNFPIIVKEPISERFNIMLESIGKSLYLYGIIFSLSIIYGTY